MWQMFVKREKEKPHSQYDYIFMIFLWDMFLLECIYQKYYFRNRCAQQMFNTYSRSPTYDLRSSCLIKYKRVFKKFLNFLLIWRKPLTRFHPSLPKCHCLELPGELLYSCYGRPLWPLLQKRGNHEMSTLKWSAANLYTPTRNIFHCKWKKTFAYCGLKYVQTRPIALQLFHTNGKKEVERRKQ